MPKKSVKSTVPIIKKKIQVVKKRLPVVKTNVSKSPTVKPTPLKVDSLTKKLNENLISLQKIELSLIDKFDNLAKQISSLLAIFESAAKTMAKSPEAKDTELAKKVDKLFEQNKAIMETIEKMGGTQHKPAQPAPAPQKAEPQPTKEYQPQSPPPAQPQQASPEEKMRPAASGRELPRF